MVGAKAGHDRRRMEFLENKTYRDKSRQVLADNQKER
jgi:hypothetical protein